MTQQVYDMSKWTNKEILVFHWLVENVNGDEQLIYNLIDGHSYSYSSGVEEVEQERYDHDPDYHDWIDSQQNNWVEDTSLPGSG